MRLLRAEKRPDMKENQCQADGCSRPGVERFLIDKDDRREWRYFLCDHCDGYLLDYEKYALARTKGVRTN